MCAAAAKPSARQRNAVKDEQECRHAAWLMWWIDLPIREIVGSGDSTSVVCPSDGQPIASRTLTRTRKMMPYTVSVQIVSQSDSSHTV